MSEITVRRMEVVDLPEVVAALTARPSELHRRRLSAQERGGFVCLVARLDGTPAGFVGISILEDADPDALVESRGHAKVHDLFVEEAFQRRGLARALMLRLEREARVAGVPGIVLETGTSDYFAPARGLYRSLGYTDEGAVYLEGWSDPYHPGVHSVDPMTIWLKTF
ncbi:MAG: GNAT family N-acetyltransferase [Actinomycetota bacterium]